MKLFPVFFLFLFLSPFLYNDSDVKRPCVIITFTNQTHKKLTWGTYKRRNEHFSRTTFLYTDMAISKHSARSPTPGSWCPGQVNARRSIKSTQPSQDKKQSVTCTTDNTIMERYSPIHRNHMRITGIIQWSKVCSKKAHDFNKNIQFSIHSELHFPKFLDFQSQ